MSTLAHQIEPARCKQKLTFEEIFAHTFKNDEYLAEPKYDGLRYLLQVRPNGAAHNFLTSRRISVKTSEFVEKQELEPKMKLYSFSVPSDTIFDGEILGGDLSTDAQHEMANGNSRFVVWDIIMHGGQDVREAPLAARRKLLVQLERHFPDWMELSIQSRDAQGLLGNIQAQGGEGIVLKKATSTYGDGWVKVKAVETFDVFITGYETSTADKWKEKGWIANIKLGMFKKGKVVDCGKTSGFDDATRELISTDRDKYLNQVIEIEAQEQLRSGKFRHPRFIKFRDDKNPKDCVMELDEK